MSLETYMDSNENRPWLRWGVSIWIVGSTLAVWPGQVGGDWAFTLYREIKHGFSASVGWLGLALFCASWIRTTADRRLRFGQRVLGALGSGPILLMAAWLSWMTSTRLWVRVPENHAYELVQWLLLGSILVLILASHGRSRLDPVQADRRAAVDAEASSPWELWVSRSLLLGIGIATLIGGIQVLGPIPGLLPIQPELGTATHTSVFGWKNPMALALAGQLFLLVEEIGRQFRNGRRSAALALTGLLVAEVAYLASLGSRTAYMAVVAGVVAVAALSWAAPKSDVSGAARPRGSRRRALAVLFLGLLAFSAAFLGSTRFRERSSSMAELLSQPQLYWQSDRGLYLRNTLVMVEHHPWGVGLGDWQTQYPVFRRFDRFRFFDREVQVRRAHSDHVQMLGEGGWLGLALWLGALTGVLSVPLRAYWRGQDRAAIWRVAQWTAIVVAMATDYVTEMPYHKLLVMLLAFLCLARAGRAPVPEGDSQPDGSATEHGGFEHEPPASWRFASGRPFAVAFALGASLLAAVMIWFQVGMATQTILAARIQVEHRRALGPELGEGGRLLDLAALERAVRYGHRLEVLPGVHKGLHRDYAAMASAALRLAEAMSSSTRPGDPARARALREQARAWCRRSVELHPHYIVALKLMSQIVRDPEESRRWLQSYHYVLGKAEDGYRRFHPLVRWETQEKRERAPRGRKPELWDEVP